MAARAVQRARQGAGCGVVSVGEDIGPGGLDGHFVGRVVGEPVAALDVLNHAVEGALTLGFQVHVVRQPRQAKASVEHEGHKHHHQNPGDAHGHG